MEFWKLKFGKLKLKIEVLKIIWKKLEFWKLNLRIGILKIKFENLEFENLEFLKIWNFWKFGIFENLNLKIWILEN